MSLIFLVVALTALSINTVPEPVLQVGLKAFASIILIMRPTLDATQVEISVCL